jgi:hypothetical protein
MSITYEDLAELLNQIKGEKVIKGKLQTIGRLIILICEKEGFDFKEILNITK